MDDIHAQSSTTSLLLPYWVQQALIRNNLNTADLLDYTKLRQILSIEDMAHLLCVNYGAKNRLLQSTSSWSTMSGYGFNVMSDSEKKELETVIRPLSFTAESEASVIARLSSDDNKASPELLSQTLYGLDSLSSQLFVVHVKRGLLTAFKNRDYALRYVSDYLKALYGHEPLYRVSSQFYAYEIYLELLRARVFNLAVEL